jgi:hypothetical protein
VTDEPLDANKLSKYTVAGMQEKFPFLDWREFFGMAFRELAGKEVKVGDDAWPSSSSRPGSLDANKLFKSANGYFG